MPILTGSEYYTAFAQRDSGELEQSWWPDLIGIVKEPTATSLPFARPEFCQTWIPIPMVLVKSVELLGKRNCEGVLYNYVKLTLNLPTTPEGMLFANLFQLDSRSCACQVLGSNCGDKKRQIEGRFSRVKFGSCDHPTDADARAYATGVLAPQLLLENPGCVFNVTTGAEVVHHTGGIPYNSYLSWAGCDYGGGVTKGQETHG